MRVPWCNPQNLPVREGPRVMETVYIKPPKIETRVVHKGPDIKYKFGRTNIVFLVASGLFILNVSETD